MEQAFRDYYLLDNGYEISKLEPCMYVKSIEECKSIVKGYDFFIFSNDLKLKLYWPDRLYNCRHFNEE